MGELITCHCKDGMKIAIEDVLEWSRQHLQGLTHLHSKGTAHGDIHGDY